MYSRFEVYDGRRKLPASIYLNKFGIFDFLSKCRGMIQPELALTEGVKATRRR